MRNIAYIRALLKQNFTALDNNRWQFLFLSGGMMVQNAFFFILWVIFFGAVHDVRGWSLSEIGLYQGIVCIGVGSAFFLANGSRSIADRIRDGGIDSFLVRPRHPLPPLLSLEANAFSLGDVVYGFILLLVVGAPGVKGFLLALAAALCVGVIFLAVVIIFQSLAFFINGASRLAEELFIVMIILASTPQNAQGMLMKLVLFSILPAGFMGILPVEVVRHHSGMVLLIMIGAAIAYTMIAVKVFQTGLKRYTSATGWKV